MVIMYVGGMVIMYVVGICNIWDRTTLRTMDVMSSDHDLFWTTFFS